MGRGPLGAGAFWILGMGDVLIRAVSDGYLGRSGGKFGVFPLPAASSGSAQGAAVIVDFGADWNHLASTVVTGKTWVGANTKFSVVPIGNLGAEDESAVAQFSCSIDTVVAGDGFTLRVFTPVRVKGSYTFHVLGV